MIGFLVVYVILQRVRRLGTNNYMYIPSVLNFIQFQQHFAGCKRQYQMELIFYLTVYIYSKSLIFLIFKFPAGGYIFDRHQNTAVNV